ncbi:hypothetical protein ACFL1H_04410 [Nanoarchaeota archaeon]
MTLDKLFEGISDEKLRRAKGFRNKIAGHYNPVEFVNNMYGSHPGGDGPDDYFTAVYKN